MKKWERERETEREIEIERGREERDRDTYIKRVEKIIRKGKTKGRENLHDNYWMEVKLPYEPGSQSVRSFGLSVRWLVCHISLKVWEVSLPMLLTDHLLIHMILF